jgi:nitroreductase
MRWFKPDAVDPSLVERLIWAATRASSPNNTQPWDFVVVQDPEVRGRMGALFAPIAEKRWSQPMPVVDATEKRTRTGARNLITTIAEIPVLVFVCGANRYPPDAPEPTYMYSAMYAASQNLVVAARALGLGAAFTTIHSMVEPALRELLAIPDDRTIGVTMPVGWPARSFGPVTRRPVDDVVHFDHW